MLILNWVKASIECEGCGKPFSVFLDPGDLEDGMDLHDLAREAVVNGNKSADNGDGFTSVQGGLVLCRSCTQKVDAYETPNDLAPTREQVEMALAEGVIELQERVG